MFAKQGFLSLCQYYTGNLTVKEIRNADRLYRPPTHHHMLLCWAPTEAKNMLWNIWPPPDHPPTILTYCVPPQIFWGAWCPCWHRSISREDTSLTAARLRFVGLVKLKIDFCCVAAAAVHTLVAYQHTGNRFISTPFVSQSRHPAGSW